MHSELRSRARLLVISLFVFTTISCTSWITAGYTTLATTGDAAKATETSFIDFDAQYQHQLVLAGKKAGKNADAIEADLTAYRTKRVVVVKALTDLKAVLTVGPGLLQLAEKGTADKQDIATWTGDVFKAADVLSKALQQIGAAPVISSQLGGGGK